jgi:hypothetical protein
MAIIIARMVTLPARHGNTEAQAGQLRCCRVREGASRPVSRVLEGRGCPRRDGHSSGMPVARHLEQPTRVSQPERPACLAAGATPLFGLAPDGACHAVPVARSAVRSYRTFSPLPHLATRRFDLCGAIPGVAPAGRYPASLFRGARTFLDICMPRPSGRLAASVCAASLA